MLRVSRSFLRTALTFVVSFGLAKGISFAAALALPRLIDTQTYGLLELALTIGAFGASLLGLSAQTAATRLYLVDKDPQAPIILIGLCLWLAVVGLCAAGIALVTGYGADYVLCTAVLGLFGIQFATSAYTRMRGLIHLSGWFDNISILFTTTIAILFVLLGTATPLGFAFAIVLVAAASAISSASALAGTPIRDLKMLALKAFRMGASMTLYGLVSFVIFGTSRISIAKFLTIADVASFSLCARIALVLVFLHQILSTGFFPRLYQMEKKDVGRIMAIWIVALAAFALAIATAGHFLGAILVIGTEVSAETIAPIFPIVVVQTTLWILNSNLELYINRELLAHRASLILGALVVFAAGLGMILHAASHLTLLTIIYLYSGVMLASLVVQMKLLARHGFSFKLCYAVLPLVASPLLLSLL